MISPTPNKKIITAVTAIAFALLLSACGTSDGGAYLSPTEAPEVSAGAAADNAPEIPAVEISEIMANNSAALMDDKGHFLPWAELHNVSESSIDITGWSVAVNGTEVTCLPQQEIGAGEYRVVFLQGSEASASSVKLNCGDEITLFSASGIEAAAVNVADDNVDIACAVSDNSYISTVYATPGYPNTDEGYCSRQEADEVVQPLAIYEVSPASASYDDFVEVINTSEREINLSEYFLSDKCDDLKKAQLPDTILYPGEKFTLYCERDLPFSLNPHKDSVYLSDSSGCVDFVSLTSVPAGGSIGRILGENGWFVFSEPTPEQENRYGARQVSAPPTASVYSGIYENSEPFNVELFGASDIYYALGGSDPVSVGTLYTQPVSVSSTTVIRAYCQEDGKLPSEVVTYSYIINEGLSLPVISVVSDAGNFSALSKEYESSGCISFFEDGGSFCENCGITLSGNKSLNYPKKSLNIYFRSCYGASSLKYDLYGTENQKFDSLTIRAGQDYTESFIRNELWQDVCLEASDNVLSQQSRYCVMFFNGEYFGIYALKENLSTSLYANVNGIEKEDVEQERLEGNRRSAFYEEVYNFCRYNDMSEAANYEYISGMIDVASFADYFVIMGFAGNNDLARNIRLYRSPANGLKWSLAFFDLDLASRSTLHSFSDLLGPYDFEGNETMRYMYRWLLKNRSFRQLVVERFSALYGGTLSNENLLEKIEAYREQLSPDMARDRARWFLEYSDWERNMNTLAKLFCAEDWQKCALDNFCYLLSLTSEERAQYFPEE